MTHFPYTKNRFLTLGIGGLVALTMTGLTPLGALAAPPILITGNVTNVNGDPISDLRIYFDNVDCAGDPDDDFEYLDVYDPDHYGNVNTDADGDFAFSGWLGECYLITAEYRWDGVESTVDGRTAINHIIGAPGGLTAAGLKIAMIVDGIPIWSGGQWLKVEVPDADPGTGVILIGEYPAGEWWILDWSYLGIDPSDLDDPTIFDSVGGLPHPDETVIFETYPGVTYALVYEGDQTYYPQLNGGVVVDPINLHPLDEDDFNVAAFDSPADPVFAITDPFVRGASVTGKVVLAGAGDLTDAVVQPWRFSPNQEEWAIENWGVSVEADGSFTVSGLTPEMPFTLSAWHPDYARTWLGDVSGRSARVDEEFTTFDSATSGGSSEAGTITLAAQGAKISASLDGFPADDDDIANIVFVTNVETNEYVGFRVDDSGFLFDGLTPGVHTVEAWSRDWNSEEETHGAEAIVEAAAGQTTTVNLTAEDRQGWFWDMSETTIRGKAAVEETITVDAADWIKRWWDEDPWNYDTTWVRDGKIVGSGPERTLEAADAGHRIYAASLASAEWTWPVWSVASTDKRVAPGPAPRISTVPSLSTTTPRVGEPVTATPGVWSPAANTVSYLWFVDGVAIPRAVDATYTPDLATLGKTLSVTITVAALGYESATVSLPALEKVAAGSFDFGPVGNPYATKLPATMRVGSTLQAAAPTPGADVTYQWYRGDVPIKGATNATYTLVAKDLGAYVTVKTAVQRFGYQSASYSSTSVKVIEGKLASVKAKLKGTAKVGKTLKAQATTKTAKVKTSVQWYVGGKKVTGKIGKKASFKPKARDKGKKVYAKVTVKKAGYQTVTKKTKTKTIR